MDRYQQTLQSLQQIIEARDFDEEGRLPTERALSERLGVGRRILRRALGALEAEGRILRHQGRGTFVLEPASRPATARAQGNGAAAAGNGGPSSAEGDGEAEGRALIQGAPWLFDLANPMELIELRLTLEPVMCRLAALRASRLDVEELRKLVAETESAANHEDYQRADSALHRRIAELSRNALFVTLQDGISKALRDSTLERFGESGRCFKRQAEHVGFHRAIVEAIAERDCERAETLMHDHLSDVHQGFFVGVLPAGLSTRRQAAE